MTGEFSVAVHGLIYLMRAEQTVSSRNLADNMCTNPARVRKVMAELGRAGLVQAREGRGGGGYRAIPDSGSITLLQVLDALGNAAVPDLWRTGDLDRECLLSTGIGALMDDLCRDLNDLCRARLKQMTLQSVSDRIFSGTGGNGGE